MKWLNEIYYTVLFIAILTAIFYMLNLHWANEQLKEDFDFSQDQAAMCWSVLDSCKGNIKELQDDIDSLVIHKFNECYKGGE